jgi:hypothetical protein
MAANGVHRTTVHRASAGHFLGALAGVVFAVVANGAADAAPTTIIGSGSSAGINAGFGNAVGSNSNLAVSTDGGGNVSWVLTTGGGNLDNANAVVIYIDADNGGAGYPDTKSFNDTGSGSFDQLRAATSATNGSERADVTFAPGFLADYALVFNSGFGVSFKLNAAGHEFIHTIHGAGFGSGGPYHFSHTMADLGLPTNGEFRYVLTYLDPVGTFRSNEFHGVADPSVPDSNIGFGDVALATGDFNTFRAVPEPAALVLGVVAALAIGRRSRR